MSAGDAGDAGDATVYVSLGNSDDRLSQREWAGFCAAVVSAASSAGQVHGVWYSSPESPWQNACICLEVSPAEAARLREQITAIRTSYRQDSAAWALVTNTEFI